jgi:hypothetical protein
MTREAAVARERAELETMEAPLRSAGAVPLLGALCACAALTEIEPEAASKKVASNATRFMP